MDNELALKRISLFPETTRVEATDAGSELTIGGVSVSSLATRFGTPLYLYDAATIAGEIARYSLAARTHYPGAASLTYAGKAYLSLALAEWMKHKGLRVDCTGLGELAIAAAAGLSPEQIVVHGVNKSQAVLAAAVQQAGVIVVDNLEEVERLVSVRHPSPIPRLWLRFRPGQTVTTHRHIQTGHDDSKFGMGWDEALAAARLLESSGIDLDGLHFHLGSQFQEAAPVLAAVERTLDLAVAIEKSRRWHFSPGGGLGVAYHEDDLPAPEVDRYVAAICKSMAAGSKLRRLPMPNLVLEPGRSLVARAGVAVYQVGTVKRTGGRVWGLLDGGLADNLRPALYGARYSGLPVRDPLRQFNEVITFAGPYCESGDILIQDLPFAGVVAGDLVAVPVSGAYQLSMGSNYNGATKPAVVWLEDGRAKLIEEREAPEDLLRRSLSLNT
jgi:diaminopimelate decarboxylase